MKQYKILTTFDGSQDGRFTERFQKGDTVGLSDYLAAAAPAGSIAESEEITIKNKAIISDGAEKRKGGKSKK